MKLGVLCYIKDRGKTLFLHRNKKQHDEMQNQWIGLGGKIEEGEFPHDAVIREVFEESGLTIVPEIRAVVGFFNQNNADENWYAYVFAATQFQGKLLEDTKEGTLQWIEDSQIEQLPLLDGDRILLHLLTGEEFISAKFVYADKQLLDYKIY